MQIWSIKYSSYFRSVNIHKHCLYWKVFSTDIYRKIIFNCCCFFSFRCWSVNCMSWLTKFQNFFSDLLWNRGKIYIWGLEVLSFMESSVLTFQYFCTFFTWSENCSRDLFSHFVGQQIEWVESFNYVTCFRDIQKLKHYFVFETL